jgi:hypothetical protein
LIVEDVDVVELAYPDLLLAVSGLLLRGYGQPAVSLLTSLLSKYRIKQYTNQSSK